MNVPLKFVFKCAALFFLLGAPASRQQTILAFPVVSEQDSSTGQQTASTASTVSSAPSNHDGASSSPQEGTSAPTTTASKGDRPSFLDKLTLSGLVDIYYGYNFNSPDERKNALRNFDVNSNQFSLNLAEFSLERVPDPLGFRVDFMFGDTAKLVNSAEPGGDHYQYLKQAYASCKAPLGKGLTIDFGKFVTQHGAEVIESKDNWNYSRSLLFSLAIPYYHFGARARYPFSDKLSFAVSITNGWNDVVDNNSGKTYGFQAAVNPTKKLSIVQNYMVGPEQTNDNRDLRQLWDTTVTYTVTSILSLMANYDYGMDRVAGSRVQWKGIAGYARIQINSWLAVAPRLVWFADPQGFTTGLAQEVKEGTLTAEFRLPEGLLLRGEYRQDWSNQALFQQHDGARARRQQTATLGVLYFLSQEH
jgi:hypothetical protein